MKNILITGGAGFIGSNLIDYLFRKRNFEGKIICVDDFNDYYDPKIKHDNIAGFRNNKNFVLYENDITNFTGLSRIFFKNSIDTVVHLAARAGVRPSISDPILYEKVNLNGTINLLELCRKNNVQKFIFASSSSVYGNNKKTPFSEEDNVDFPISPYAATKKAGELICHTYHHLFKISIFCLRFFTVYGPRQRPEMAIHKFAGLISREQPIPVYGDGSTSRDYTYIDDIIEAVCRSLDVVSGYEIINLGNSNPTKLIDLIRLVEKSLNKKAVIQWLNVQPGDVEKTHADISRAKKLLKYQPSTPIENGIEKFINWFSERN